MPVGRDLDKLIVVAGHAAFKDSVEQVPENPANDEWWVLQAFQSGEPSYYIEHIKKGAELLAEDDRSLLLFSGGRTRREAGHWSEATTYQAIAEHYKYWESDSQYQKYVARTALEQFARDSFENLQFSLYQFYRLFGKYPRHVTVVGWKFKADRFHFHRETLNIPSNAFTYVGCNNPEDIVGATKGEERALAQFRADPKGERGPLLGKRHERNPFNEQHPYQDCPPIQMSD